jgi:hypothetical protein
MKKQPHPEERLLERVSKDAKRHTLAHLPLCRRPRLRRRAHRPITRIRFVVVVDF